MNLLRQEITIEYNRAQQQVHIGKDLPRSSHPSYNMILQLVYIYNIFNMQHIHTLENSTT